MADAVRNRLHRSRRQEPLAGHFPDNFKPNNAATAAGANGAKIRRRPLGDASNSNAVQGGDKQQKGMQSIVVHVEDAENEQPTAKAHVKRPFKDINKSQPSTDDFDSEIRVKRPHSSSNPAANDKDRVEISEPVVENVVVEVGYDDDVQLEIKSIEDDDLPSISKDDAGKTPEKVDEDQDDDDDAMSVCSPVAHHSYTPTARLMEELNLTELDEQLLEDPQYNAVYVGDILEHYRKVEVEKVPKYGYMKKQKEITEEMRRVLVDWLTEVHMNFKLKPETIFLAVNIMDRFLEVVQVSKSRLQLVGCTSLLIASKYEDIYAPEISELEYITKSAYTKEEIIEMESIICNKLQFRFTLPTPYHFAQRFVRAAIMKGNEGDEIDESLVPDLITETYFFMQLSLLEYKCLEHKPSGIAAASLYLAFQRYQMEWNDDIVEYTEYQSDDINECVMLIYKVYRKDRDQVKAGVGKPSAAGRYYAKKKQAITNIATQML